MTLRELKTYYSLDEALDMLEVLAIQDDADYLAMKASQPKGLR